MSNKPGDEAQTSRIDPKPSETLLKPEPGQLSDGDLDKAVGGSSGWGVTRPTTPVQSGV